MPQSPEPDRVRIALYERLRPQPEYVRVATITAVDHDLDEPTADVNAGSVDGVQAGDLMIVTRQGDFIASIHLKEVDDHRALGDLHQEGESQQAVLQGDKCWLVLGDYDVRRTLPRSKQQLVGYWSERDDASTTLRLDDKGRYVWKHRSGTDFSFDEGAYDVLGHTVVFYLVGKKSRFGEYQLRGSHLVIDFGDGEECALERVNQ